MERPFVDRLALGVETGGGTLRLTRRLPQGATVGRLAVAAASAALLAIGPDQPVAYWVWCLAMTAYTGFGANVRARHAAARAVVSPLRHGLEIAAAAADCYRGGAPKTLRIDGGASPLAALKRVAVERLLTREVQRDGGVVERPFAARVVLIFDDRAVVERSSSVEGAVSLAAAIADAAGLAPDWLADRVARVGLPRAVGDAARPWDWAAPTLDFRDAHDDAHAELPFAPAAAFALLRLAAVLGLTVALAGVAGHPLAEHPPWRWALAAALCAASLAVDAVVVAAGARLVRSAVRASMRALRADPP